MNAQEEFSRLRQRVIGNPDGASDAEIGRLLELDRIGRQIEHARQIENQKREDRQEILRDASRRQIELVRDQLRGVDRISAGLRH